MTALIFDCDGVLADTERYGHLPAFNQMFEELGLPVRWSEEEYGEKLKISGGKERMASLLTEDFVRDAGLPTDPEGQQKAVAGWHRRKTDIYTEIVAAGRLPGRPGVARITAAALDEGWALGVASTSSEASVRAVLEHVVGSDRAARFALVLAGDVVPKKKPAPDIYQLALARLGVEPGEALVIEDSRNGLLSAVGADLTCLVTVSSYTQDEDFSEAALVVSSLGEPGGEPTRVSWPTEVSPNPATSSGWEICRRASRFGTCTGDERSGRCGWRRSSLDSVELVVRTMAETACENEQYFGELDAVVGDGDFGYSMARGFELVLAEFDSFDREDIGTFLKKIAVVITSRVGGTSGPLWGTAFLRAGATAAGKTELTTDDMIAMLRAAIEGIKKRGQSDLGDKTLLDALVPAVDELERALGEGNDASASLQRAAATARERAEATREMLAKRGRAAYTGERSIGTLDAGAVAVAIMFEQVAGAWAANDQGEVTP